MNEYLTVEVEHNHYTRIFSVDQARSINLSLTTLVDYQKKAEIKIFLISEREKQLVHTHLIDPLPRARAGEPQILLKADYNGRYKLTLEFSLNDRPLGRDTISLRKYIKRQAGWPLWLILIPVALIAAAALLLLPRACLSDQADTRPVTEREGPASETVSGPAVESPSTGPVIADTPAAPDDAAAADSQSVADSSAADSSAAEQGPSTAADSTAEDRKDSSSEDGMDSGAAFSLSRTIYFPPDSPVLTEAARQELQAIARDLADREDVQVEIIGHCALYGTEEGRAEISGQRARNTEAYLRSLGWDPQKSPAVYGMGAEKPITRNTEEQQLNRRVEITVVPADSNNGGRQDR